MNGFLSYGKKRVSLFHLSLKTITKKISLNKKRDLGMEKLKKEIENKYSDQKDHLFHSIKNQTENLSIKSRLQEVGDQFDKEFKSDIKELGFDFSKFKKRNEKLEQSTPSKDEKKENPFKLNKEKGKKEDKDDKEDLKNMLDENTFEKLEEMISIDKSTEKMIGKTFDVNDSNGFLTSVKIDPQHVIEDKRNTKDKGFFNEESENNSKNILVHRPERNYLWGLGEEVKNKKRSIITIKKEKFTYGMYPKVEEIVSYLEMYNLQDILIVSRRELGLTHLYDIGIICTGFNAKHLYKSAKDLLLEVKKLELVGLAEIPNISGRKDEEWLTLQIGEITVHLFTEKYRQDVDLIGKWTRKDDPEFLEFRTKLNLQINQKKNSKFK